MDNMIFLANVSMSKKLVLLVYGKIHTQKKHFVHAEEEEHTWTWH